LIKVETTPKKIYYPLVGVVMQEKVTNLILMR